MKLAQDRVQCWTFVIIAATLQGLQGEDGCRKVI